MNIGDRIRKRREELGLSQEKLALRMGYKSRSAITKIEKGQRDINQSKIMEYAKALETTPAYLMNWKKTEKTSNIELLPKSDIHMIPVFQTVSAGFGAYASDEILEYIPLYIENEFEAKETLCIKVSGDSMYPKIEDGDTIQVRKQDIVDNGQIAVVLIDGEEGLVKKVYIEDDYIELISINPEYPPKKFIKEDMNRVSIVGLVRKIIKEC